MNAAAERSRAADRKARAKILHDDLKHARARVREAKGRFHIAVREVRAVIKAARAKLRAHYQLARKTALATLALEAASARRTLRMRYHSALTEAARSSGLEAARLRRQAAEEAAHGQKEHLAWHAAQKRRLRGPSAKERRQESDDEVRINLEHTAPELVAYFERIKSKVRSRPGMSRTEAVLHAAHEDAAGVLAAREHAAHVALERARREEEAGLRAYEEERKADKARARQRRRAQAAEVPF